MRVFLKRLGGCRRGATAVEYGFILALICIAVMVTVTVVAGKTVSMWTNVASRFATVQG